VRGAEGRDGRIAIPSVHERADGAPFHVEVVTRALVLDGADHSLVIVRDVTEERLTQAALTESAEQVRAVFQSVPMVQLSLDTDGRFTLLEGRGLDALRLQPGELVGRTIYEAAKELPDLIKGFLRALGGTIFVGCYRVGRHHFDVHWAPLLNEDGTIRGVSGIALEVTARIAAERARKETEARLVAAERLVSMGRLAAGVAHEINNPLAWVMSNLEFAIDRAGRGEGDPELAELLGEAKLGAERVRDIVRDLRVFARSEGETGGCDAVAVARASLAMARNELRHRAQVETRFEQVPMVAIPQRQLGQVLVNLLVNAAQAIREGSAADNAVTVGVRPDREGVVVEVRDTGSGMPREIRERIFEPFFTTKQGEGMGLGLALCQTMVHEAGGEISVESEPGKGSTFRVWLPTAETAAAGQSLTPPAARLEEAASKGPEPTPAPGRRSRVLVVDDEPLVGKTVARVLVEHDVEYVPGAEEALERIHHGSRYDALVCDLMMPEMTGMDLAQRLADEEHELSRHMVFLTGGAFTDRARAFVALTRAPVVEKPFEQAQLKRGVDLALRGPCPGGPARA
jgi:signal transduction histidine kinase